MLKQITIIGIGLIGSSVARAVKHHNLAEKLVCADADEDVVLRVEKLGFADDATQNASEGVKDADLVILATPLGAFGKVTQEIAPHMKAGAVLTDTGSVKQDAISAIQPFVPDHVSFVPGHPIAGTEQSGPEAGFYELFINRWAVLTPLPDTDAQALGKMVQFWESCGSRVEIMDPQRHDLVLAITSHLPHLIAYSIVGTATDLEEHLHSDVIKFSASGFRDFTRIAASDPVVWRDIFLGNNEAVLEVLQRFNEDLTALQKAIRWKDGRTLEKFFTRTRHIRREVIEAGQADYVYPDSSGDIQRQEGTPPLPALQRPYCSEE